MTKGRDNAAESMKDVFALIRSRKQSGVLSVERFENGLFEEGEIHFQAGRPVQGFVNNLTGEAALHHLSNWRRVYFVFSPMSTLPSLPASKQAPTTPLHPSSPTSLPPPASSSSLPSPTRLAPRQSGSLPSSSLSSQPSTGPLEPSEADFQHNASYRERTRATDPMTGARGPTTGPLVHQNGRDMARLVPHKLSHQVNVMSLSLNRLQRSVYLLVDGQRSVADLARFTGRAIPDILQTLVELRARNLVNM